MSEIKCSFCGKSVREVAHIIAGPTSYICDECVSLCVEIIVEKAPSQPIGAAFRAAVLAGAAVLEKHP